MIEYAINHKENLMKEFQKTFYNEKFKYYQSRNWYNLNIELSPDTWTKLELVSVDSLKNVNGYFSANYDRVANVIDGLIVILFSKTLESVKDFDKFIKKIYNDPCFRKIEWFVVVGNPAEKLYDRICKDYNGRIVGYKRKSVKLIDGKFYDLKLYEMFLSN